MQEVREARAPFKQQAPGGTPGLRDLRRLLWASIDNSLDLDPLAAAESLSAGAVKIRVAIADADSLVHQGLGDR